MQKRWIILFVALLSISFLGLFYSGHEGVFTDIDSNLNFADIAWMITATIFVLMMTPGLSFFYGGMVRSKNVISTMLQSFIAMGVISVIWVVVGFSLAFGEDVGHFIGNPGTFFMFVNVGGATDKLLAPTIPLALYAGAVIQSPLCNILFAESCIPATNPNIVSLKINMRIAADAPNPANKRAGD